MGIQSKKRIDRAPEAFRLEIRSGRFLMRQRRCLGSPHPDFASFADSPVGSPEPLGHLGHFGFFPNHTGAVSRAKMAAPVRADIRMSRLETP
jgi:hypothetical protein